MTWKVHNYDLETFWVKPELSANKNEMSLHLGNLITWSAEFIIHKLGGGLVIA